eukprot:gnl/TRDRNA2_/TRDRNA2_133668_c0_seq1.p1 gnl/TRDRNA2_/TRDRNA2_133668_c0~~gnl/TRDRNA2_/TRDRNA2_133668_c0_seq1.p1  ORF type:complete len:243 (-),score=68.13 gnl/TRDRNA2_/TRDRNA2_133668_c0_seq1:76-804(-)
MLMNEAHGEEARSLVEGNLFAKLLNSAASNGDEDATGIVGTAATVGSYSHALLEYISVRVLQEDKDAAAAADSEKRLRHRLVRAHKVNPFAAEFIAFAPAFESAFPVGCELPPLDGCPAKEQPLIQALEYCCRYGQVSVWLDTDDDVRAYIRETVFEDDDAEQVGGDEKPPLEPLPAPSGVQESPLLKRWKAARQAAMELWAQEMMGGEDGESGEEGEESDGSPDSETIGAFAELEERRNFG